jgi:hypothetical protein
MNMSNKSKTQELTPVSLNEHNDMVKRICSAITGFFEPRRITVHQVELPEEVLNRSVLEVISCPPNSELRQENVDLERNGPERLQEEDENELTAIY